MKYEVVATGECVFSQGDKGDKFYVVIEGKVSVLINDLKSGLLRQEAVLSLSRIPSSEPTRPY